MVADIVRDSFFGQVVNYVSDGKVFPYPEQLPDFKIPPRYLGLPDPTAIDASAQSQSTSPSAVSLSHSSLHTNVGDQQQPFASIKDAESGNIDGALKAGLKEREEALQAEKIKKADYEADILVDWYVDNDQANPQQVAFWCCYLLPLILTRALPFLLIQKLVRSKKIFGYGLDIAAHLFSLHCKGSAIYTPGITGIQEEFGVSLTVAELGLTLFVMFYGIGPMFLSPLQEIPLIGRNTVYIITLWLFFILQIPLALSTNIAGLLVLRALTGFLGSPALATGGASLADISHPSQVPYVIATWAIGGVAGPVLGPVIGGFAAEAKGWRWPFWELAWLSGFSAIVLTFLLPETLSSTILLRRARRLRKLTGNPRIKSQSEIDQAALSKRELAYSSLVKPFKLMLEPAVLMINIYIALVYAIFYLWFESFPLVYTDIYHFTLGTSGLPFLAIIVAEFFTLIFYFWYLKYVFTPRIIRAGGLVPEMTLTLGLFAGPFIPASQLLFGWSARSSVHWIVPTIGVGLYLPGIYLLFQSAIVYLPLSYPNEQASVLAGNALFRSSFASVFPLFGRAMFVKMGLGGGSSLLAGLSLLMVPMLYYMIQYGPSLRAKSKYASA